MRIAEHLDVSAPPALVWDQVSDPERYLHFMSGVTRWEVAGDEPTGVGARYRMLLRVGSAEVGGLIEIVEHKPERDLAWNSVTGVDQRGRWRIREREGGSLVELRLQYGVAGAGISGWIAERLASRTVSGHLQRSLRQLKRQVEHEQLRAAAPRGSSCGSSTASPAQASGAGSRRASPRAPFAGTCGARCSSSSARSSTSSCARRRPPAARPVRPRLKRSPR